ncbi:MAG: DUF6069 family protein [Acidimicrobiales bacterium]
MTRAQRATRPEPLAASTQPGTGRLVRVGALWGGAAAAATTAAAALAEAGGVSLEVDAQAIPIAAFAWWTIIGAALGVGLARLLRRRRAFVAVTAVATALSLVPAIAAPDDTATRVVLVAIHLLAAALIIPPLSRQLPTPDVPPDAVTAV